MRNKCLYLYEKENHDMTECTITNLIFTQQILILNYSVLKDVMYVTYNIH